MNMDINIKIYVGIVCYPRVKTKSQRQIINKMTV